MPGSSTSTADPGQPIGFRGPPSESSVTPSLAFDDWLLRDERALLLSGAPGSGKSTVLRCLALDLVRTPELFPAVHDLARCAHTIAYSLCALEPSHGEGTTRSGVGGGNPRGVQGVRSPKRTGGLLHRSAVRRKTGAADRRSGRVQR